MTSLKRRFAMSSVALAAFALAGTIGLCAEGTSSIDYQKTADRAQWSFTDAWANPLSCMCRLAGTDYDVWLIRETKDRHALTINFIKDDRPAYQWKGHKHSVFRIRGDRLYYAEFHYSGSGGNVVAVDLNKGNELWRSPLKALGEVAHSAYLNRMTIDANDEVVSIYGNESMGRYVEFKDTRTGKTVGHKRFPTEGDAVTSYSTGRSHVEPPGRSRKTANDDESKEVTTYVHLWRIDSTEGRSPQGEGRSIRITQLRGVVT